MDSVVDLYLTIPNTFIHLGGFVFAWLIITHVILYSWNYFNGNNKSLMALYDFGLPHPGKGDSRSKAASVVADRQYFSFWYI
jgi:hypothetical protein